MLFKLFILFTVTPLIELALLIKIGSVMGVGPTTGLVLITGALGAWLARAQGLAVIRELNERSAKGEMPTDQIADGLMILVGGALLLTPGIITDFLGFSLVMPFTRKAIRDFVKKRIIANIQMTTFSTGTGGPQGFYSGPVNDPRVHKRPNPDDIIDI